MADNNGFESWRSTWVLYGPIVMAAAQVIYPLASAEELGALVIESAAQGFVDTDRIDPLDALLAGLLHGRSPHQCAEVAKALTANGIDTFRASAVTGSTARHESPRNPSSDLDSDAPRFQPPDFDAVRARASAYETKSTGFATDRLATRRITKYTQDEAADDAATDQRWHRRRPKLVAGFGVVCALVVGSVVVAQDVFKTKPMRNDSVGFLIAENIPEAWELIDAKAFVSFPSIGPTLVAQRFTNPSKSVTILLGTNADDFRYSDPSLGVKQPQGSPIETLRKDSKAEVMDAPGQTKRNALFKFWGEGKTYFYWGPDPLQVELASGRVVTRGQTQTNSYQWTDRANSNFAQFGVVNERMGSQASRSQGAPEPFFNGPSSAADNAKVEILLDALKIGTSKQWSKQLIQLQPDIWAEANQTSNSGGVTTDDLRAQKLGFLGRTRLTIGPNELHLVGPAIHGKAVGLCTTTLCTRIYYSADSFTYSADLIIDGHWWHFENLFTKEDEPTFRTSPSSTGGGDVMIYPKAEAGLDKSYRWWGIDFGPDVQAARRNEQRELFLRPVQ